MLRFLLIVFLIPLFAIGQNSPKTLILRGSSLLKSKKLIETDDVYKKALKELKRDAGKLLNKPLYTVMSKSLTPDSGDKHDYMSFGPYWWPDPKKDNGLPFIRKDGQVNPASKDHRSDQPKLSSLLKELKILSVTYYLSTEEKYAARAAVLIKTWFLNPNTKMNPNLNYGQAIPGRTKGRGIGIIETRYLGILVDALILFEKSSHFKNMHVPMKQWLDSYLNWLLTSKNGIAESKTKNNHATWYDVQVAVLALYCGKNEILNRAIIKAAEHRIPSQIQADGSQPHELSRTRSFDYSRMNLLGFLQLARLSEHTKTDLWKVHNSSILKAVLFLKPYAEGKEWKYKQIKKFSSIDLYSVLKSSEVYRNSEINDLANKLKSKAGTDIFFY
jgi:hypothetical protein